MSCHEGKLDWSRAIVVVSCMEVVTHTLLAHAQFGSREGISAHFSS